MASSSSQHAWEQPGHAWEGTDDSGDELRHRADDSSDDDGNITPARAAEEFVQAVLDHYFVGTLSAIAACQLFYWAGAAGMIWEASKLGKKPGAPTGHYQRHLDERLGLKDNRDKLYAYFVPAHRKHDVSRASVRTWGVPVHEALQDDMMSDPRISVRLREAVEARSLPEVYFAHPVVQRSSEAVLPYALYMDAVPYSRVDSVLGFWVVNLLTQSRHLVAMMRKRWMCKCGCRGWCSLYNIYRFLVWGMQSAANGVFPSTRHDGTAWMSRDSAREAAANTRMPMSAACLFLKGDWSEYCSSVGFPTWQSVTRPCMLCNAFGPSPGSMAGVSLLGVPWHENTEQDYSDACARCEIAVDLTAAAHARIKPLLAYDKRDRGAKGRMLKADIPDLFLEQNDRLEPCPALPNVGAFEYLASLPVRIIFWRCKNETIVTHRNPLLDPGLGLTADRSLTVDLLHCLHLGVFMAYAKHVIHALLGADIRAVHETTFDEKSRVGKLALRGELQTWYKQRRRSHPDEDLTRANDLTLKMVGPPSSAKMKLSGAETWGVVLFLIDALDKYAGYLGTTAGPLREAGLHLVHIIEVCRAHEERIPFPAVQDDGVRSM